MNFNPETSLSYRNNNGKPLLKHNEVYALHPLTGRNDNAECFVVLARSAQTVASQSGGPKPENMAQPCSTYKVVLVSAIMTTTTHSEPQQSWWKQKISAANPEWRLQIEQNENVVQWQLTTSSSAMKLFCRSQQMRIASNCYRTLNNPNVLATALIILWVCKDGGLCIFLILFLQAVILGTQLMEHSGSQSHPIIIRLPGAHLCRFCTNQVEEII